MKKLDGQTIFAYMTNIDDKYIEEAAYATVTAPTVPEKVSLWSKLSRAVNHPAGVAVICGIVALGVLGGIIWAGRNAPTGTPVTPPAGDTSITETEAEAEQTTETYVMPNRFSFDFEFYASEGDVPEFLAGGGGPALFASVTNLGDAFTFEGPSDGFVPVVRFVHSQTGHELTVEVSQAGSWGTHTVQENQIGRTYYSAPTSESTDTGFYDLILSYGGESQIFPQVIRIYSMGELTQKVQEDVSTEPVVVSSKEAAIEAAWTYIQAQNHTHPFPLEKLRASVYIYDPTPQTREYKVSFVYDLGGLATDYRIRVTVHPNGNCTQYSEAEWSEDSYFLRYTDEEVQAAIDRMDSTYEGPLYFEEKEGKLYVCKEVIVDAPDDELGHKHIFYKEEVKHED